MAEDELPKILKTVRPMWIRFVVQTNIVSILAQRIIVCGLQGSSDATQAVQCVQHADDTELVDSALARRVIGGKVDHAIVRNEFMGPQGVELRIEGHVSRVTAVALGNRVIVCCDLCDGLCGLRHALDRE